MISVIRNSGKYDTFGIVCKRLKHASTPNWKTMNIEEFRDYCIAKKGITEEFPFDEETLVFKVMGKMFALCGLEHNPLQISLKCDPERAIELREQYDGRITEAWHMSKKHWNSLHAEALPEA